MKSKRIVSIVVFGLIVVITPVIFALKSQVNTPLKSTINELNTNNKVSFNQTDWNAFASIEQKITVLKNTSVNFPLRKLNQKIARISIGTNTGYFTDALELFADVDRFYFETLEEAIQKFPAEIKQYDVIITAFHEHAETSFNTIDKIRLKDFLVELPNNKQLIGVIFGNPTEILNEPSIEKMNTIIVGYENTLYAQDRIAQLIFGAIPASGKLPFSINDKYPKNAGILIESSGRLKFSQPEEFGISSTKFNRIDSIVTASIAKGAFPGCQIVVAYKGKIIYRKAFGRPTFESEKMVENSDVYDIASVSKIAGSTVGIMKLESEGKFSLNNKLGDYLPELTKNTSFHSILIKDMMAHQAGLTAWIPFYKRTMQNGEWKSHLYSTLKKPGYETQVANNLYIKDAYIDSIYQQILSSSLGPKKYEYSDLGYYFIKKIIEKQSAQNFQEYLMNALYLPMGLRSMRYQPLNYFAKTKIIPTENDQVFRKQLVHGFVHDPGAAMLGGVGGHAGVFSNATDLASLMQLFLNKGTYGNEQYLTSAVVSSYTKQQFQGNRRGAGFDRPKASGGGTCHELTSQESYGHSGFTGTLVWADPTHEINYVFLSNRVCPSQDNWKIRDLNIRTEIQRVIYEALNTKTKK
jgi:CubicO group peptidase (beta-lactamase class C family)